MIKLIFFDCDGTLLSHNGMYVPDSTKRAFELLEAKGIRRVLSTGRHVSELKRMPAIGDLRFDAFITINGACTYDKDGILCSYEIEREDVQSAYDYLKCHDLGVEFFEDEEAYVNLVNETVIRSQESIHDEVPHVLPLERILIHPIYQIVGYGIRETEGLVSCLNHVRVTRWNASNAVDMVHASAGKESGMEALMKKWGIEKEETMAFGDALNDLSMLREAGIGVAMGNSEPALKEAADYVAGDIDADGLYLALVHFGILDEGE